MKREILKSANPGRKPHVFLTYDRAPLDLARLIAERVFKADERGETMFSEAMSSMLPR